MLYGVGDTIGPDLTGSNRADVEYLLSNIVDPSGADRQGVSVDGDRHGRRPRGHRLVTAEDDKSLTIRTRHRDDWCCRRTKSTSASLSDVSMMPDDQLKQFTTHEILSLFAYLRGKPAGADAGHEGERQPALQRPRPRPVGRATRSLWSVENGEIVGRSAGLDHNTFLVSDLAVEDFRLSLEVKLVERRGQQRRAVPLRAARRLRGSARLPGRHRRRLVGQALRRERPRAVVGQVGRSSTSRRASGTTTKSRPSAAASAPGSTASRASTWTTPTARAAALSRCSSTPATRRKSASATCSSKSSRSIKPSPGPGEGP